MKPIKRRKNTNEFYVVLINLYLLTDLLSFFRILQYLITLIILADRLSYTLS